MPRKGIKMNKSVNSNVLFHRRNYNNFTGREKSMKMNKSVLQRSIIFILCSCILFSICPVYAFAAENQKERVVRIGVPDDTYDKINGHGKRSGYGYEYLQKIAGYTGWNYEYVDCTWENCFDKLKNDELDMIEGISYTEERAENMLFSGIPMGDERYCVSNLYTRVFL